MGGASTFLDSLFQSGVVNKRVFSLYFGDFNYNGDGDNSIFTVGEYNAYDYSDNNLIFLPVYKPVGLWSVQLSGASFGGTAIGITTDIAVLNSTSQRISMPPQDAQMVYGLLSQVGACGMSASGMLLCDCGMAFSPKSYPDLVLTLGTRTLVTLKPTDYFLRKQEGCYLMMDGLSSGTWVLGQPFLRAYYTVYDMDNQLVGMAASRYGAGAGALVISGLLLLLWSA